MDSRMQKQCIPEVRDAFNSVLSGSYQNFSELFHRFALLICKALTSRTISTPALPPCTANFASTYNIK